MLAIIAVAVALIVAPYATAAIANTFGGATLAGSATSLTVVGGAISGGTAGLTSTIVGGAIAGAAGSIVSQAVGVATGIQEKFSWKAVAMAAIGGGVGAGFGYGGPAANVFKAMLRGAASSAVTQGIGVVTGLQDKFDWAGIAAAGVGAGLGQGLAGSKVFGNLVTHPLKAALGEKVGSLATKGVVAMADAIGSAATLSLTNGSDFGDNVIAALPQAIASVLGPAIGEAIANACFVAGTMVQTPKGLKAIEALKAGDWVFARDEHGNTDTVRRRQVLETYRFEDKATLGVVLSTPKGPLTISTTALHPFAVEDGAGNINWIAAQDLDIGDAITRMDGLPAIVTSLQPEKGLSTVYNFAVDEDHTYFIEHAGVWVHNTYAAAVAKLAKKLADEGMDLARANELANTSIRFGLDPRNPDHIRGMELFQQSQRSGFETFSGVRLERGSMREAQGIGLMLAAMANPDVYIPLDNENTHWGIPDDVAVRDQLQGIANAFADTGNITSLNFGRTTTKAQRAIIGALLVGGTTLEQVAAAGNLMSGIRSIGGFDVSQDGTRVSHSNPEWLARMNRGVEFNRIREPVYTSRGGVNELYVDYFDDGKLVSRGKLDSYIPGREIVSRKNTQLSDLKGVTGAVYINELKNNYAPGTPISSTASVPAGLRGERLVGSLILEVPVQNRPVPQIFQTLATRANVTIRDANGVILNPRRGN